MGLSARELLLGGPNSCLRPPKRKRTPMKIQSVSELADKVAADPELQERLKKDPAATIASLAAPLANDVWIYRMVVGALGMAVLLAVSGAIVLAFAERRTPDVLTALGSAAVGDLAG